MRVPVHHRRRLQAVFGWIATVGFVGGIALVYFWAGLSAPSSNSVQPASSGSNVTMRLENAPFVGHSNGFKTWSLLAGRIELERMPGSSLASIESVALSDIKDGLLFPAPPPAPATLAVSPPGPASSGPTPVGQLSPESEVAYGPWTAKFRAGHGHYNSGLLSQPPPELALLYRLQTEFDLSQGVVFRTREGDLFEADSLSVLDLLNKKSGHSERRVLCNNGMKLTRKDARVTANQARYDVANRTVECLGGAHVTIPDGMIQTERMYWTLDTGIVRCPEATTGTFRGIPFVAQELTLDIKKRTVSANHIRFDLRNESKGTSKF